VAIAFAVVIPMDSLLAHSDFDRIKQTSKRALLLLLQAPNRLCDMGRIALI
jgi:hypothetical protein